MSKTLVIAEKPSVGRDYAKALPGTFTDRKDYLESDDYVVSWAVGHLVELAEPEDYDSKYRVLVAQAAADHARAVQAEADRGPRQAQLGRCAKLIKRKDVDEVVNGCDAGREGELIFPYIYELAGASKPVSRLWVSSMTRDAIREGFDHLRDGAEMAPLRGGRAVAQRGRLAGRHERHAARPPRSAALDGVVSLGRVQTPTLALIVRRDREIDAFVPETYFQVGRPLRARRGAAPTSAAGSRAARTARRARAGRGGRRGGRRRRRRTVVSVKRKRAQGAPAAALRPDQPAARGEPPLRHVRRRARWPPPSGSTRARRTAP